MHKALYVVLGLQSVGIVGVVALLALSARTTPAAKGATQPPPTEHAEEDGAVAPSVEEGEGEDAGHAAAEPSVAQAEPSHDVEVDAGDVSPAKGEHAVPSTLAADVAAALLEGNARFAQGLSRTRDLLAVRKAPGAPKAVVVGCSDAVVPPEMIFDQPLGALVTIRTAGHFVDDGVVAAVDDAIARQHAGLLVVLGHVGCPVVAAARRPPAKGEARFTAKLRAGLGGAPHEGGAEDVRAVEANVTWAVKQLAQRARALRALRPAVLRAVYDEASGEVRWLDAEAPSEKPGAGLAPPP